MGTSINFPSSALGGSVLILVSLWGVEEVNLRVVVNTHLVKLFTAPCLG